MNELVESEYDRKKRKAKEPIRVADYLVEADWCCECASKQCIPYKEKTYPIGQQPEGAVMVPGSERELGQ